MYDDDRDALAAEYVLGTLSADERDQAEALLAIDPGFAEIVRVWERRLGELNVMVEAVEPPPEVWDKIKTQTVEPDIATSAPRLTAEEEFSFPPIEDDAPETAHESTAQLPPEAAATEPVAEGGHKRSRTIWKSLPHRPAWSLWKTCWAKSCHNSRRIWTSRCWHQACCRPKRGRRRRLKSPARSRSTTLNPT
jgi:hypothetical protein